jgi:hypothetical protein
VISRCTADLGLSGLPPVLVVRTGGTSQERQGLRNTATMTIAIITDTAAAPKAAVVPSTSAAFELL